jgi:hypothetical protein
MRLGDVAKFFMAQNMQRDWDTQLLQTVRVGDAVSAERLISAGANVNTRDPTIDFRTPLHWAARNGDRAMIELLLARGADTNSTDQYQRTAFDYCIKYGHMALLHLLQDASQGNGVSLIRRRGLTPLPEVPSSKATTAPTRTLTLSRFSDSGSGSRKSSINRRRKPHSSGASQAGRRASRPSELRPQLEELSPWESEFASPVRPPIDNQHADAPFGI